MGWLGGLLGGIAGGATPLGAIGSGLGALAGSKVATPELGPSFNPQAVPENPYLMDSFRRQQEFLNALQGQQGLANQNWLGSQLQQQAMGQGPNPAQAMLAQNTGQNVSQQAALMNSGRGAGANPGLMNERAAQQGAHIQQESVGQAAAMKAQQQLLAQQQLQQLSQGQIGQQQGGIGNLMGGGLGLQGQQTGYAQGLNSANAGLAGQQYAANMGMIGGLLNGAGAAGGMLATGGASAAPAMASAGAGALSSQIGNYQVPQYQPKYFAEGGIAEAAPMSILGQFQNMSGGGKVPGKAKFAGDTTKNDTVSARLSPGEVVIPKSKVHDEHKIAGFLNALLGTSLRAGHV